ncbi:hypothetical protein A2G06_16850 (plasmid) [Geobacter anodireducens]|nr:hypothetical protein A2G06_16850 [Geobacter anodireducens]
MAIFNRKGFFHMHTGAIMFVFALIGCWYMYRSFQAGNLKKDFGSMVADCEKMSDGLSLPIPEDRRKMEQAFATIREIAARNNIKVNLPGPAR